LPVNPQLIQGLRAVPSKILRFRWDKVVGGQNSVTIAGKVMATTEKECVHVLVWMDLEMTGLDPLQDLVVEIATIITDDDLNVIAAGPDLVIHVEESALDKMDEVVTNMHTRSGLLELIRTSTITLEDAMAQTLAFLNEHISEANTIPLCGNSIGTDRSFLSIHMKPIDDFLHYRNIDVSTIKELGRRWLPDVVKQAPRKASGHRALDDILESIEELRFYRQALFITKPLTS
jgi:oligoribonuclease